MALVSVNFRLAVHRDNSLRELPNVLNRNMRAGLEAVGKRLITASASRMRKDSGRERRSLTSLVQGKNTSLRLTVYSNLIQAFVDAYGLRRGVFPNFRVNSQIYQWAERRAKGIKSLKAKTVGTPAGPHFKANPAFARKVLIVKQLTRVSKATPGKQGYKADKLRRAKSSDTRRMAFLIARSIFNYGIKATQWNSKALQANRQMIVREMQNAISRTVNELARG